MISAGILLRSTGSVWALYDGAILIGIRIAPGNVLRPDLIKRDFSGNVASVTGAYSITIGTAGAIGSAIVIPLTQSWGWNMALAMLVIAPLLALLLWLPQLKEKHQLQAVGEKKAAPVAVWRSPLAWQITLFMSLNAMPFYVAVGWLPAILMDSELSSA